MADRLVAMGRLGQKTGGGWYRYDEPRKPTPDPEVVALIRSLAAGAGIAARTISDEEIVERAIYALVNEGRARSRPASRPRASDIDVIYVNGYGFPGWRGGPMFYADRVGLGDVLGAHPAFHGEHGERWRRRRCSRARRAGGRSAGARSRGRT